MSDARAGSDLGVVLAGGRSSRMGRPKAWLELEGETFLGRVVRIVGQRVGRVMVVAAPEQELPPLDADVRIVRDASPAQGPLAGLVTALDACAGDPSERLYLSSCDVPLLVPELIDLVLARLATDVDIAVPRDGAYHHPLAAAYRIATVRPAARALVAAGRLRPVFLFESMRVSEIDIHSLRAVDPELDSLLPCNTPEEYAQILARARARG